MSLRIIKSGILDTVQDKGRFGYQHLGINPGGAMDKFAAHIANTLVGNAANDAVIELHFPAAGYFFEQSAVIAITGADFYASINGDEIPRWQPVLVNKFSILQFYRLRTGARAYLAIHGGLHLPKWLNSYSTNLKIAAGGYKGRGLQKDDEIEIISHDNFDALIGKKEFHVFPWKAGTDWGDDTGNDIMILPGNEWERLDETARNRLTQESFIISNQSDRMAYRLDGERMIMQNNEELISSAVSFGTIQLLPDGQLIVLMADYQTTGGYARIAHVISAHHSKLAQRKPGEELRFVITDQSSAEELYLKQQQHLLQLEIACKFRLEEKIGNRKVEHKSKHA
jgi:antagonist of KipI